MSKALPTIMEGAAASATEKSARKPQVEAGSLTSQFTHDPAMQPSRENTGGMAVPQVAAATFNPHMRANELTSVRLGYLFIVDSCQGLSNRAGKTV